MDPTNQAIDKLFESNKEHPLKRDLDIFKKLFERFKADPKTQVEWDKLQTLPEEAIIDYTTLNTERDKSIVKSMLQKIIIVKLNGGLGTSMGCRGPKSIIPVRDGLTFLDLTLQQLQVLNCVFGVNIPLVLMNSFNTHEDTLKILKKYTNSNVHIFTFNQSCHPRIHKETLLPIPTTLDIQSNLDAWTPPGHGDFYVSFKNSGLLDKFLAKGKEYCFLSNVDNLGATVDINIVNYILGSSESKCFGHECVLELTNKTRADVKGGTLIKYEDKLRILEIAQVPKKHESEFKSVKKFKLFNTNNLWIKLAAIDRLLSEDKLNLDIIQNNKTLPDGTPVIQLETIVGGALQYFENVVSINVPRCRFLPVKKCNDLLLVMSNLYTMEHGFLKVSPDRMFPGMPDIKLDDKFFSKVDEFLKRFGSIPDMLDLDHLTVMGDVVFGKNVSLKGTIIIIADKNKKIEIPSGAVLENKIILGDLLFMDY